MGKNACKLCSRRFASPRALAGHMRSHSIAAAKPQISSASSASISFTATEDDASAKKPPSGYALRENPKRSLRLAEAAFSDRESEAESTPPRAKRAHAAWGEPEQVSSVTDAATPEEDVDVALSLMMLSRDSWPQAPSPRDYSDDGTDDGDALPDVAAAAAQQKRRRYQCSACKKVFPSYQALGGHRASHIRGGRGGCCAPPLAPPSQRQPPLPECDGDGDRDAKPQRHECPHCYRVFASGQALGGHKRSHVCSAAAAAAAAQPTAPPTLIKSVGLIDLNLPAPIDDVELSAVSGPPLLLQASFLKQAN